MMDNKRYIVRFWHPGEQEWRRSRTLRHRSGLYRTRALAEKRLRVVKQNGYKAHVAEIPAPERIMTWGKWSPKRMSIRRYLKRRGFILTGGDRTPERNEQVGGVPNSWHQTTKLGVFADDFYHPDMGVMRREARNVASKYGVRTLVHDAGTGQHLHIEGEV